MSFGFGFGSTCNMVVALSLPGSCLYLTIILTKRATLKTWTKQQHAILNIYRYIDICVEWERGMSFPHLTLAKSKIWF